LPSAVFFEIEKEDRQSATAQKQSSPARSTNYTYTVKVVETRRGWKLMLAPVG
jgi:hypothetical protein